MGMSGQIVKPAEAQHTSFVDGTVLYITVPSPKRLILIISISIFLAVWLFFEFTSITGLIVAPTENVDGSLLTLDALIWFLFTTALSGLLFVGLLWQIRGREVIKVNPAGIEVRKEIFSNLGLSRQYSREYIKDLRISPFIPATFGWRRNLTLYGLVGGFLAFDYGANTIHFGVGADEAEAKQIYQKIIEQFPKYGKVQS